MGKYSNYIDKDYRLTIPISLLKKYHHKVDEYLKIIIKKGNKLDYFYSRIPPKSPSRRQTQVRRKIPERVIENLNCKKGDKIIIKEIKVLKVKRSNAPFRDDYFDLLYLFPDKNIMCDIFFKNNEEWCRFWSSSKCGGIAKEIELKRFIPINRKIGEMFGLMQAESRKYGNKFDFTNIFISEHKLFLEAIELFGIQKSAWKFGIIYNQKLNVEQLEKYKNDFSGELGVKFGYQTISKTVTTVAYSIYIDSRILNDIMNEILTELRYLVYNNSNQSKEFLEFLKGFITKDMLGDGTVVLHASGRSLQIFISEQDSIAQKDVCEMFKKFNIKTRLSLNHIYLRSNIAECIWYILNGAFIGHHQNRRRIINHFVNHPYIKLFYERLNNLQEIQETRFAEENDLNRISARAFLTRNVKRGYLQMKKNKKGRILSYKPTQKGKDFLEIIKQTKKEHESAHPLILPIGESDRTGFEIPDSLRVSTTSGKNLYAAPASSANPL